MSTNLKKSTGLNFTERTAPKEQQVPPSLLSGVPLGTIISSMLDYDQFRDSQKKPNDPPGLDFDAASAEWAPCDGRSIEHSLLAPYLIAAGVNPIAPDLRGKFLRGLNLIHSDGEALPFFPNKQGNPDDPGRTLKRGKDQDDAFASHNHSYAARALEADDGDGFAGLGFDSNSKHDWDRTVYVDNNGSATETRPRNISTYFYIKIN